MSTDLVSRNAASGVPRIDVSNVHKDKANGMSARPRIDVSNVHDNKSNGMSATLITASIRGVSSSSSRAEVAVE
jgi:hypothetical protein